MNARPFVQLAMPLCDPLYSFAYWLAGNRAEAEDLVQKTYLRALADFGTSQQGSDFRAWIYRGLHHAFLISRTALTSRSPSLSDGEEIVQDEAPVRSVPSAAALPQKQNAQCLMSIVAALPLAHREIIVLCDIEGFSCREAAEILSMPLRAAVSRLSQARSSTWRCMSRCHPGDLGTHCDWKPEALSPCLPSVRAHIAACPQCSLDIAQFVGLRRKLRAFRGHFAPRAQFRQGLRGQILTQPPAWRLRYHAPILTMLGAMAALLLVLTLWMVRSRASCPPSQTANLHPGASAGSHLLGVAASERCPVKSRRRGQIPFTFRPSDYSGFDCRFYVVEKLAQPWIAQGLYETQAPGSCV